MSAEGLLDRPDARAGDKSWELGVDLATLAGGCFSELPPQVVDAMLDRGAREACPGGGASPAGPALTDVQAFRDTRRIAIQRVGVKDVHVPVRLHGGDGQVCHTVAQVEMTVSLGADRKGSHLSRFLELVNDPDRVLSLATFRDLLRDMVARLEAESGRVQLSFPYFRAKTAPVSGVRSLMDYRVTLVGELNAGRPSVSLQVAVPVTSLCPCSKEISRYGAHNQRSCVTVTVPAGEDLWIEDLIVLVENEASCELYALLKRADEKFVTERAYDNPKFVEDMVRDVAARLDADPRVAGYVVECENFESIHNHSAYARIENNSELIN